MAWYAADYWQHTLLHQAALRGRVQLVQFCIDNGAPLDLQSNDCGLPGNGLWEFYPSMVGAPKAALGMVFVYATLVVATWSKPAVSGQDAGGSSKASEAGFVPGTPTTYW